MINDGSEQGRTFFGRLRTHPIGLALYTYLVFQLFAMPGALIDVAINGGIEGPTPFTALAMIAGSVYVGRKIRRTCVPGGLGYTTDGLARALLMMIVPAIAVIAADVPSLFDAPAAGAGIPGMRMTPLSAALTAVQAGIVEEMIFRGAVVNASFARHGVSERGMRSALAVSALLFGGMHLTNVVAGVAPTQAIGQAAYTCALGFVLAAVYVRTRNLLSVSLFHGGMDLIGLMMMAFGYGGDLGNGLTVDGGILFALIAALFLAVGLYVVRPSKRDEIMGAWRESGVAD